MFWTRQNVVKVDLVVLMNKIIYETDAPRLCVETGAPIDKCVHALSTLNDYEAAKRYLNERDQIQLTNIEGD